MTILSSRELGLAIDFDELSPDERDAAAAFLDANPPLSWARRSRS